MTKHFCDKCGKEIPTLMMWDVRCDARDTGTYFHFEICSECMLKLKNFFISRLESEVNPNE